MASPISRKLKSENLKNYEKVRSLAADGMTVAQISAVLGISSRTFYIHLKKDKKLLKAYEEGQQAGVGEVVHALKDLIRKGNLGAIIFWLKNKDPDNWKDDRSLNVKAAVKRITADMSDDELMAVVAEGNTGPQTADQASTSETATDPENLSSEGLSDGGE